jgi:hypothetical protein
VKDVWWVKEYKSNRFVYYPVVIVVKNHQRRSQHMEDWFLYKRELKFDQYVSRKKKMNHRSHRSFEKIPNIKRVNFSLRIPAVWSFFFLIVFFSLLLMMTIQCHRYLSLNQHSSYGVSCARCALRFIHNTYICISKLILLLIDPCPHLPHWGHWQIYHHRFYVRYITANDSNDICSYFLWNIWF